MQECGVEKTMYRRRLPNDSQQFVFWCRLYKNKKFGLYFFSEPALTCENSNMMIRCYAMPNLSDLPESSITWQHGISPLLSLDVRSYLDTKILWSWFRRETSTAWPPRSLDSARLHSFLCCFVKGFVFSAEVTSMSHMNERIEQEVEGISTETLGKVLDIWIP